MKETTNSYAFADFIRFVAMCAIIFQHSFIIDKALLMNDPVALKVYFGLKVIAKIGSISFFMISGYLLTSALERYSTSDYIKKRLKNIIIPYVIFVLLYLILDSIGAFFGKQRISNLIELPAFIGSKLVKTLFHTSYWFILNYFISLTILLSLRKYLYNPILGLILGFCTLIYSINCHLEWFPAHHTTAFAGFIFFLWLGANLKKNEVKFWNLVNNTSLWKWSILLSIFLFANLLETFYLLTTDKEVIDSSLKITNIFYALTVFVVLCKISQKFKLAWFEPRIETYPLYLIHPIFLKVIIYAILPSLPSVAKILMIKNETQVNYANIILYQVLWFVAIYMISLFSIKVLLKSKLAWIFGK